MEIIDMFPAKTPEIPQENTSKKVTAILAATSETDGSGRPQHVGMINGGFYPKKDDWPAQYPSVVIAVQDVKASMKKVAENGGEILGDPMDIPGIGIYVSFYDTEKNRVAMLQPVAIEEHADTVIKKKSPKRFCGRLPPGKSRKPMRNTSIANFATTIRFSRVTGNPCSLQWWKVILNFPI